MGDVPTPPERPAKVSRAQLRRHSQLTVPADVRKALHIEEGDEVEFRLTESGAVVLRGMTVVPADQRWFWTDDWQAGEREASEQLAHNEGSFYADVDAMFADLNT